MAMTMEEVKRARENDGGQWVAALPANAGLPGPTSRWKNAIALCRENPGKWRHYVVGRRTPEHVRDYQEDDIVVLTCNHRKDEDGKRICDMYMMSTDDSRQWGLT